MTSSAFPNPYGLQSWWREGVLYQVYPRSFADSNGDGVGDLPGVIDRLDHLEWLGIDGIWLNPTMPSPNADWGYDVSDYFGVHPELGTLADLDRLVSSAATRGIRVLLDLVPNHTSDRHPWFMDARVRTAARRDWYVWADPRPDGSPPNDWVSVFDGPAWTLDETTGQYYLHQFLAEQPDLNWWNAEVKDAFDEILRFWFSRGIAGFRIDVAHAIVKDRALQDLGIQADVHEVHRRWRALADAQGEPARILLGETHIRELEQMVAFYGSGEDELHLAFNFPFVYSDFEAERLAAVVAETERLLPAAAWPVWTGSNHDSGRFPTRWCGDDDARTRLALIALLTLRGTPVLYYGDELGMAEVEVRPEQLRDPVGLRRWPDDPGRDRARTPMQWSPADGAGFTEAGAEPWLPLGAHRARNVEDQRRDPDSILCFCRELIALRRTRSDLRTGAYRELESPPGVWAWRRGERVTVALNMSEREAALQDVEGTVLASSHRGPGESIGGVVALAAWEGVVVDSVPLQEGADARYSP
jgi:alpha-glucosidase